MKKQILFLMFFVAAILAGMNAFGQSDHTYPETPDCISPQTLNCANATGELNPLPGTLYTYTVETSSQYDDVRWFVINNNLLETAAPVDSIIESATGVMDLTEATYPGDPMVAGGPYVDPADGTGPYILRLGTSPWVNYNYSTAPDSDVDDDGMSYNTTIDDGVSHSIEIAWKSFNGDQPNEILLVALVADQTGCTNNIEVYRIVPEFLFTLDIAALNNDGDSIGSPIDGSDDATECVSPIEYAWYNASSVAADENTPGKGLLTVDYGENWIYFVVNAANFVDSWMPKFQISHNYGGTAGNTDYITAEWAYQTDNFAVGQAGTQTWYNIDASGFTTKPVVAGGLDSDNSYTEFNAVGDGASPTGGSECIIVRVRLDWGTQVENATADVILSFAVEGVMFDPLETAASDPADQFDFSNTSLLDLGNDLTSPYDECDPVEFDDIMDYTITQRPQVLDATGTAAENFELNTGDNTAGTPNDPNDGSN